MLCKTKTVPKEEEVVEEEDGTSEMLSQLRFPIKSILDLFSPLKERGMIHTVVTKFEDPMAPTQFEQRILGFIFAYPALIAQHLEGSKADTLRAVELLYGFSEGSREEIETFRECANAEELRDSLRLEVDKHVTKAHKIIEKISDTDFVNIKAIVERLSLFNDLVAFYGGKELFVSEPDGEAIANLLS